MARSQKSPLSLRTQGTGVSQCLEIFHDCHNDDPPAQVYSQNLHSTLFKRLAPLTQAPTRDIDNLAKTPCGPMHRRGSCRRAFCPDWKVAIDNLSSRPCDQILETSCHLSKHHLGGAQPRQASGSFRHRHKTHLIIAKPSASRATKNRRIRQGKESRPIRTLP